MPDNSETSKTTGAGKEAIGGVDDVNPKDQTTNSHEHRGSYGGEGGAPRKPKTERDVKKDRRSP